MPNCNVISERLELKPALSFTDILNFPSEYFVTNGIFLSRNFYDALKPVTNLNRRSSVTMFLLRI